MYFSLELGEGIGVYSVCTSRLNWVGEGKGPVSTQYVRGEGSEKYILSRHRSPPLPHPIQAPMPYLYLLGVESEPAKSGNMVGVTHI